MDMNPARHKADSQDFRKAQRDTIDAAVKTRAKPRAIVAQTSAEFIAAGGKVQHVESVTVPHRLNPVRMAIRGRGGM